MIYFNNFFSQLVKIGDIFLNKFDVAAISLTCATPFEAVSRVLPLIYTQQALGVCAVNGTRNRVRLYDVGLLGIEGE